MSNFCDAALEYAKRGWKVFPLSPQTKVPLAGSNGVKDATTDFMTIRRWWSDKPTCNIGIATGFGFFVLDVDGEEGSRSLTAMEQELGALPETLEAATGGGGRHLFFDAAKEISNKQGVRPGLDVRGMGGYIVAPPSVHPNGRAYQWPFGENGSISKAPIKWLNVLNPAKKLAPWDQIVPQPAPRKNFIQLSGNSVVDRAKKYLLGIPAAMQGQGGHSALMWAARALITGFELDKDTTLQLLWDDYNPRCCPRWERDNPADRRDFERKVAEVFRTPSDKPRGWLLDKYNLTQGADEELKIGHESRLNLLRLYIQASDEVEDGQMIIPPRVEFPVESFPPAISKYIQAVAQAHCVDPSVVALAVLTVAAAAVGNSHRLQLKGGYIAPTTLWGMVVADSGTNKSGPIKAVVKALYRSIPLEMVRNAMCNPQHAITMGDATIEAVVAELDEAPRGLLVFHDELSKWFSSHNVYKNGGGDENTWLEFWNAAEYQYSRKTLRERLFIPAASVGILGGIQTDTLKKFATTCRHSSGLVARFLVATPPAKPMLWTDSELTPEDEQFWEDTVIWLRGLPFKELAPDRGYIPNILTVEPNAKETFVEYYNEVALEVMKISIPGAKSIASKNKDLCARMILVHHMLSRAAEKHEDAGEEVKAESVEAGIDFAEWFLNEQLRTYGMAVRMAYVQDGSPEKEKRRAKTVQEIIREHGGKITPRQLTHANCAKYPTAVTAREALQKLGDDGLGVWDSEKKKVFTLK